MNKNPRFQAWKILVKVFQKQVFSNVLLNEISQEVSDVKTKNLIFNLVHGTISRKIYLAYLTEKLIDKTKTPIEVQVLLWMSFYQIFCLQKIPNYAVVNESVEIAKKINPRFARLVNACLRQAIRDPHFLEVKVSDAEQKFCLENAFPFPLYQQIVADYGSEIAKSFVIDSLQKPSISIRINSLKISSADFYQQFQEPFQLRKSEITESGMISQIPVLNTSIYQNGLITVQDQASIMVGEVLVPTNNERVWDMCSAPGGKLTHLAALMNNSGEIVATEISKNKIPLIEDNLKRLGVENVQLINQDALKLVSEQKFDKILLDAPCSGIGVLKRKPEIKLNFDQIKSQKIVDLQAELLTAAYQNLKVNGYLVYSTCTINKKENVEQIQKFITKYPQMKIVDEKQIFGFENHTDGFYICKLQKLG